MYVSLPIFFRFSSSKVCFRFFFVSTETEYAFAHICLHPNDCTRCKQTEQCESKNAIVQTKPLGVCLIDGRRSGKKQSKEKK